MPDTVLADVVWTLEKYYRQPKAKVAELLTRIVSLRGLRMANKRIARAALQIYAEYNVDWTDAFVAAEMKVRNSGNTYSYDHHFDMIPGIRRLEP